MIKKLNLLGKLHVSVNYDLCCQTIKFSRKVNFLHFLELFVANYSEATLLRENIAHLNFYGFHL